MGFQKGNKINVGRMPWNKGLTKETDSRVAKCVRTLTGKKFSKEHCINISIGHKGQKSWSKGLTKETDERIMRSSKKMLGNKNPSKRKEVREKISETHKGKHYSLATEFKKGDKTRLGKYHSKKTKDKISETKTKQYKINPNLIKKIKEARARQTLPIKDTKIEIKIQDFLKELGIEFFTHQYIKEIEHSYQCDILIPSMNLVIECDGDFWHKYPIGNDIDHIRTKELIEQGFKVLRLWEFEIKVMDIKQFQNKLNIKKVANL